MSPLHHAVVVVPCLALALLATAPARAGAQADLCLLEVPAGARVTATVPEPRLAAHGDLGAGLSLSWAHGVERHADPASRAPELGPNPDSPITVSDQVVAQVTASASLLGRVGVGVVVPLGLTRVAQGALDGRFRRRLGPGDVRVQLVAPVLATERFALAAFGSAALPTAREGVLLGGHGLRLRFAGVASVALSPSLRLSGRLGFAVRSRHYLLDLAQDDEAQLAVGLTHQLLRRAAWFVEVDGRAGVGAGLDGTSVRSLFGRLGLRWQPTAGLAFELGLGSGDLATPDGIGTATLRVFGGLRMAAGVRGGRG